MFFKKPKKQEEPEKPEKQAVPSPDFVVRNMPKPQSLSGINYQSASSSGRLVSHRQSLAGPENNFKKVGLIIVVGGVLVVIVLVYLSYRFLIKPASQRSAAPAAPALVSGQNSAGGGTLNPPVATPAAPEVIMATSAVEILPASSSGDYLNSSSTDPLAATTTEEDSVPVVALAPVIDSDEDGLKDEEESIFGTSPNSTDSDGDTYSDLAEINNNYNPAGTGLLNTNVNLAEYRSPVSGYQVLYPKNWEREALDDNRTVFFKAPDDSLIQISLQNNADKQSIVGWYGNAFPSSLVTYDKLKNASNWEGIAGDDGLNFYLTDRDRQYIYAISYIPVDGRRLAYPNVFQLLINSLRID